MLLVFFHEAVILYGNTPEGPVLSKDSNKKALLFSIYFFILELSPFLQKVSTMLQLHQCLPITTEYYWQF